MAALLQPVPTPDIPDFFDAKSRWALHFLGSHPKVLFGLLVLVVIVAVSVILDNVLRSMWPKYVDRPRWVKGVLGAVSPFSFNFWMHAPKWLARPTIEGGEETPEAPKP